MEERVAGRGTEPVYSKMVMVLLVSRIGKSPVSRQDVGSKSMRVSYWVSPNTKTKVEQGVGKVRQSFTTLHDQIGSKD